LANQTAVLFVFGFVFAQLQGATALLLRSSLAKIQNSSLPNGYGISSNALADACGLTCSFGNPNFSK
jgi:hypothetical protein